MMKLGDPIILARDLPMMVKRGSGTYFQTARPIGYWFRVNAPGRQSSQHPRRLNPYRQPQPCHPRLSRLHRDLNSPTTTPLLPLPPHVQDHVDAHAHAQDHVQDRQHKCLALADDAEVARLIEEGEYTHT